MREGEMSSYIEVYQGGDAVVDVYVSLEDIKAAAGGMLTIPVAVEERDFGVSEVHVIQTVSAGKVRTAEHPHGTQRG